MLTMAGKTPVRFLWDDGVSETTVTLSPDDTEEALLTKMRRVLDLAGEDAAIETIRTIGPRAEQALAQLPRDSGNGWAAYSPPELPEHLKGDYELEDGS